MDGLVVTFAGLSRDVRNRRTITEVQAGQSLRADLAVAEAAVERLISAPLNESLIDRTTRKQGYRIVKIDCYDPA